MSATKKTTLENVMADKHPITPPDELVQQWLRERPEGEYAHTYIATQAAQWGTDQELEACVECLIQEGYIDAPCRLRAVRRPTPSSLKEKALHELNDVYNRDKIEDSTYDTIRRALEQLDD